MRGKEVQEVRCVTPARALLVHGKKFEFFKKCNRKISMWGNKNDMI